MSRQSGKPTVHSITLLQERFKQLQRAKEKRRERELLRLFSESEQLNATTPDMPSRLFYSEQIPAAMPPPLQASPDHQSLIQIKHSGLQISDTPLLENLWSTNTFMHKNNINNNDDSDVDTSLHL
ncbi:hypothetical protein Dsin_023333 [Dipteronia sinensis]|uniref:Uncharacterized protein n=1 Tax=Dipteronia sinensis TaxID=43782 RepID=A0AAE0A326_9ROSI|nr:hypothetical protein Dsin_023333 [Dipteronia sinensis]